MEGITWFANQFKDFRRKTWGPNLQQRWKKRAVLKDGTTNVLRSKMARIRRWRYLQDIFTTLVDCRWRTALSFLCAGFCGMWVFFSLIWYLIVWVHGDLEEDHLPVKQAETGWIPCVLNIHSWHSCFLYSLETQHTTGYGLRVITEQCPEAIFLMCFQCIIGMIVDTFTVGIVCAKFLVSKYPALAIQFSRNAVISKRDGALCLMFRIGDIRKSPTVGVAVRALLMRSEKTQEGEVLKNYQTELSIKYDDGDDSIFLIWPVVVYHPIDEESPFYETSASEMLSQKFEIVLILDATVESTGVSVQAKTSYLPREILWGHRFEPVVNYNTKKDAYEVDWSRFDNTIPVKTPMCSAEEMLKLEDYPEEEEKPQEEEEPFGFLQRPPPPVPLPRKSITTAATMHQQNEYKPFSEASYNKYNLNELFGQKNNKRDSVVGYESVDDFAKDMEELTKESEAISRELEEIFKSREKNLMDMPITPEDLPSIPLYPVKEDESRRSHRYDTPEGEESDEETVFITYV